MPIVYFYHPELFKNTQFYNLCFCFFSYVLMCCILISSVTIIDKKLHFVLLATISSVQLEIYCNNVDGLMK